MSSLSLIYSEASEALEHISHEEDEVKKETAKMAPPKLDRERMSNLTYGIASQDKLDAINRLLYASYHPDEPITKALGLFHGEHSIPDADNRVGIMVRKNLSLSVTVSIKFALSLVSCCFRFIYDEVGREVGVCVNCGFYKHDFLSLLVMINEVLAKNRKVNTYNFRMLRMLLIRTSDPTSPYTRSSA